jgi:hypothetical protein
MEDSAAPIDARERAAEMLNHQSGRTTAEACARALKDPNPIIRFWAAYSLGQVSWQGDLRKFVAAALESILHDEAVAPGWWSVGREAQALIVGQRNIPGEEAALQAEIAQIQQDPNASAEDKRWAECYVED